MVLADCRADVYSAGKRLPEFGEHGRVGKKAGRAVQVVMKTRNTELETWNPESITVTRIMEPERLVGTKLKPNFTPVPFFSGSRWWEGLWE